MNHSLTKFRKRFYTRKKRNIFVLSNFSVGEFFVWVSSVWFLHCVTQSVCLGSALLWDSIRFYESQCFCLHKALLARLRSHSQRILRLHSRARTCFFERIFIALNRLSAAPWRHQGNNLGRKIVGWLQSHFKEVAPGSSRDQHRPGSGNVALLAGCPVWSLWLVCLAGRKST